MKMYKELMKQFLLAYESDQGNRLSDFMDYLMEKEIKLTYLSDGIFMTFG